MKHVSISSLVLAFLLSACTTGTDVPDDAPPPEQARLDRIAQVAHKLVDDAKAQPAKPASALMADLLVIMKEAETTTP